MQLSGISCSEEAHEGIRDVSVSTAGSQCTEPEKPSGQSEYDALMMQILKIYWRVMFHTMWNYVFRATEHFSTPK